MDRIVKLTRLVLKRMCLPLLLCFASCLTTYTFFMADSEQELKALWAIAGWALTAQVIYLAIEEITIDIKDLMDAEESDHHD